ncbi:MAG: prepilin peptidase [Planctomycetota bacterium]|nr:MAG: prepilin peptidase [Planctomycetota bacterium]
MGLDYWGITCAVVVPGTLLASWIDYSQRRVPNWLNATLLLCGLVVQGVYFGAAGVGDGLMGALVGFGLLIVPWLMHGMGAGDVKLMAAIGAWFGPAMTFYSFALGAVIGGVAAVVMILSSRRLKHACSNLGVIMAKCSSSKTMFSEFGSAKSFGTTSQLLPYGVPLTAGSLIVLAGKVCGWWG